MRGLLPHVMVPGAILCRVVFLHLWAAMSAAQSPGYQPRRSLFMVLVLGTIDRCGLLSTLTGICIPLGSTFRVIQLLAQ
jgi:hypothetical protein